MCHFSELCTAESKEEQLVDLELIQAARPPRFRKFAAMDWQAKRRDGSEPTSTSQVWIAVPLLSSMTYSTCIISFTKCSHLRDTWILTRCAGCRQSKCLPANGRTCVCSKLHCNHYNHYKPSKTVLATQSSPPCTPCNVPGPFEQ